ncbi:MAG: bifunctional DNA-formamidopyrimidine glycosylase/DNA-(apurinic or apyrimidinic site) lyase [Paracoccaceae bacterium]
MPELPEVETVRRGLEPAMAGQLIARADIRRPDLRWPFPPDMAARLTGKQVTNLRRRSKYILVDLSSGETLIIHLGMSGFMQVSGGPHPELLKHDHVVLDMATGARITFNDARRFGSMDIIATDRVETHRLLASLGPEPLGNTFDDTYLTARLKNRNTPIKSALLDQRIVAGLGNIYVCEVLHRTGISPLIKSGKLSRRRVNSLIPAIRDVLNEAIAAGGSSLQDHRQTDGELGYFQHRFQVYDRENQPCTKPECTGNIQRIVQAGRSSFYCGTCQN